MYETRIFLGITELAAAAIMLFVTLIDCAVKAPEKLFTPAGLVFMTILACFLGFQAYVNFQD